MYTKIFQLFPQHLMASFNHNFKINDFLIYYRLACQDDNKLALAISSNLKILLTFYKSRRIICKKEDQFIVKMIECINNRFKKSSDKFKQNKCFKKITVNQLQKFIELFEIRKSHFIEFEKATLNILNLMNYTIKQKNQAHQNIKKMKNIFDQFQDKLQIFTQNIQLKTGLTLSRTLKSFLNEKIQQNLPIKMKSTFIEQFFDHTKTKNELQKRAITIFESGQVKENQKFLQMCQKQIDRYKKIYRRFQTDDGSYLSINKKKKCFQKNQNQKQISKTITEGYFENQMIQLPLQKQHQANSNMEFAIRFINQKTNSKLHSNVSIFQTITCNPQFLKNSVRKQSISVENENSLLTTALTQQSVKQSSFLRKKSSILKTLTSADQIFKIKKHILIDQQKKFTTKEIISLNQKISAKQKSLQKFSVRQSRCSIFKQLNQDAYLLKTNQIQKYTEQKNRKKTNEEDDNTIQLLKVNDDFKQMSNQIVSNQSQKIPLQQDLQQDQTFKKQKMRIFQKNRNKRNGFSKQKEQIQNDQDQVKKNIFSNQEGSHLNQDHEEMNDNINLQDTKQQNNDKKNSSKNKNTRLKSSNRYKLKKQNQIKTVAKVETQVQIIHNQPINTNTFFNQIKSFSRDNGTKVSISDCIDLSQSINEKSKQDMKQFELIQNMKQRYDLILKESGNKFENQNQNKFVNRNLKLIEVDLDQNQKNKKWTKCYKGFEEIDFSLVVSKKCNELGQKDLSGQFCKQDDEFEYTS